MMERVMEYDKPNDERYHHHRHCNRPRRRNTSSHYYYYHYSNLFTILVLITWISSTAINAFQTTTTIDVIASPDYSRINRFFRSGGVSPLPFVNGPSTKSSSSSSSCSPASSSSSSSSLSSCCSSSVSGLTGRNHGQQPYVRFYSFEGILAFRSTIFSSSSSSSSSCLQMSSSNDDDDATNDITNNPKDNAYNEDDKERRIAQLEALTAKQTIELSKLRQDCLDLRDDVDRCMQVVDSLQRLQVAATASVNVVTGASVVDDATAKMEKSSSSKSSISNKDADNERVITPITPIKQQQQQSPPPPPIRRQPTQTTTITEIESYLHDEIFGSAPSSVTEAASAAGASILAALSAGQQRISVDVRDAELSRDSEVLVRFIELAILPAVGWYAKEEGGGGDVGGTRAKLVFPTVSQLSEYRTTAAAATSSSTLEGGGDGSGPEETVALSTLGFDPIKEEDNLIVIISPAPDDEDGLRKMNELLSDEGVRNPVLLLNHHMVPIRGPGAEFEQVYHLRLLSVQYMSTGEMVGGVGGVTTTSGDVSTGGAVTLEEEEEDDWEEQTTNDGIDDEDDDTIITNTKQPSSTTSSDDHHNALLEAALNHAHNILPTHQGITRAMVIRAYPRPWHVFVDTSPDTDADFEVAATFDDAPSQDDVNYAIVECLEGSEREDELVATQMQEALESGQLNAVSEILGLGSKRGGGRTDTSGGGVDLEGIIEDEDDDFYDDWDPWGTDTV